MFTGTIYSDVCTPYVVLVAGESKTASRFGWPTATVAVVVIIPLYFHSATDDSWSPNVMLYSMLRRHPQ